jgi:hypothetical protein
MGDLLPFRMTSYVFGVRLWSRTAMNVKTHNQQHHTGEKLGNSLSRKFPFEQFKWNFCAFLLILKPGFKSDIFITDHTERLQGLFPIKFTYTEYTYTVKGSLQLKSVKKVGHSLNLYFAQIKILVSLSILVYFFSTCLGRCHQHLTNICLNDSQPP